MPSLWICCGGGSRGARPILVLGQSRTSGRTRAQAQHDQPNMRSSVLSGGVVPHVAKGHMGNLLSTQLGRQGSVVLVLVAAIFVAVVFAAVVFVHLV